MQYPVEDFTEEEKEKLKPFFTNTDLPVFAITNLPEVVKGAMFARYSRYQGNLRRMFLDEFFDDVKEISSLGQINPKKAEALYERVFVGFGDDSVAQLGGAHIACEYVSNIVTKELQRGRLAAYLEQSTRYIAYDNKLNTKEFRYYFDNDRKYKESMNELFEIYSRSLPIVQKSMSEKYPNNGQPEKVWLNSIKAKSLDLLRGILPASTLSHVGIYASGQAYEMMIMRLLASPLPEARHYGEMIFNELNKVIPSFLSRIPKEDRGQKWIEYFANRKTGIKETSSRFSLGQTQIKESSSPSVSLLAVRGSEEDLLVSSVYEECSLSEENIREAVRRLSNKDKKELFESIVGKRENRRHRPGRGFESVSYRFEIVSDYGSFRDLQRHRMLTCQWQTLTPELGAEVPDELPEEVKENYKKALSISSDEFYRLERIDKMIAPYALCLGYNIRYILDLNAREAMLLTELRSGVEGHPSYRAVAQAMHQQIEERHPLIGSSFKYMDTTTEPRLERLLSEMRTYSKNKSKTIST